MTFAHSWVLVALLIPIALLVRQFRDPGFRIPLPFDHRPIRRRRFIAFLLGSFGAVPPLLLAVVVVILAGPRRFEQPRSVREMTNIQFCLDVSGSMMATYGEATRYDAAMEALNSFISHREGDAFGLTIFGSSVLNWVPLTSDVSAFRCAPPFLRPEVLPPWFGGTMIGMALRSAEKVLTSREEGDRMVVLITDGASYDLSNGQDMKIAQSLKDNGIVVFAIHIAEGAPSDSVGAITMVTGGEVFSAGDPGALDAVFGRIDEMRKAPLKRVTPDPVDFYQPFALAGLGLVGLHLISLFGIRPTPW